MRFDLRDKLVADFFLGPEELEFMGVNKLVLAPKLDEYFHTHLECTLCGYYTAVWQKMIYHCKLGTHRFYLYQEPAQAPIIEYPLIMPAVEFDTETPPQFRVPLKPVVEAIVAQSDILTAEQVLNVIWKASSKPTETMLCELCQTECKSTLQYKLHMNSFPHKFRVGILQSINAPYMQAFLNPSTNQIYFVSLVDCTLAMDAVAVMRSRPAWVGYAQVKRMTQLEPAKLVKLLHHDTLPR